VKGVRKKKINTICGSEEKTPELIDTENSLVVASGVGEMREGGRGAPTSR